MIQQRFVAGDPPGERVEHKFGVSADHQEQVVEIVGHPSGQPSNGIHFLGLLQFRFQSATLGDVAERGDEMRDSLTAARSGVSTSSMIKVSPFFFRFIMIPRNTFPERTVFHISS
jgi:hypothetical protein